MKLVAGLALLSLAGLVAGLSGWWSAAEDAPWHGYVEAEFVDVGAEETARVIEISVKRGDLVTAGDRLFRLDAEDATAARDEAAARLEAAKAELADLKTGRRPEEIAAIEAQFAAAEATLETAREDLVRKSKLLDRGVIAEAGFEEARERNDVAQARLAEISHQLAVARLPARPHKVEAAQGNVEAAGAALARAETRLARLAPAAPTAARVEDVFFRTGELVSTGRPVVRLLPPGNLKVRFYVAEPDLGRIAVGDPVTLACDGCGQPVEGTIGFIAETSEFTPPVIYSVSARQKLVFLVEALPRTPGRLKVGQPVDIRLAGERTGRR
jgi:HlyD family secretion protein